MRKSYVLASEIIFVVLMLKRVGEKLHYIASNRGEIDLNYFMVQVEAGSI